MQSQNARRLAACNREASSRPLGRDLLTTIPYSPGDSSPTRRPGAPGIKTPVRIAGVVLDAVLIVIGIAAVRLRVVLGRRGRGRVGVRAAGLVGPGAGRVGVDRDRDVVAWGGVRVDRGRGDGAQGLS